MPQHDLTLNLCLLGPAENTDEIESDSTTVTIAVAVAVTCFVLLTAITIITCLIRRKRLCCLTDSSAQMIVDPEEAQMLNASSLQELIEYSHSGSGSGKLKYLVYHDSVHVCPQGPQHGDHRFTVLCYVFTQWADVINAFGWFCRFTTYDADYYSQTDTAVGNCR